MPAVGTWDVSWPFGNPRKSRSLCFDAFMNPQLHQIDMQICANFHIYIVYIYTYIYIHRMPRWARISIYTYPKAMWLLLIIWYEHIIHICSVCIISNSSHPRYNLQDSQPVRFLLFFYIRTWRTKWSPPASGLTQLKRREKRATTWFLCRFLGIRMGRNIVYIYISCYK